MQLQVVIDWKNLKRRLAMTIMARVLLFTINMQKKVYDMI